MKKLVSISILLVALIVTTNANAQKFSGLDKSPMDMASYPTDYKVSEKLVRIIYSRPQLKGRSLNELAKPGEVWRTGANEAAEITFYKDVTFGGETVKAGSYALFAIPGAKEWTLILNSKLNQWGSYFYDETADVARVKVPTTTGSSIEEFSIAFKGEGTTTEMVLGWAKTRVAVTITE